MHAQSRSASVRLKATLQPAGQKKFHGYLGSFGTGQMKDQRMRTSTVAGEMWHDIAMVMAAAAFVGGPVARDVDAAENPEKVGVECPVIELLVDINGVW